MICENCPFGELIQTDSLIWMVKCPIEDALMACKDECCFPETIQKKKRSKLNEIQANN